MYIVYDKAGLAIGYFTVAEKEQALYSAKSFGGVVKYVA